MKQEAIRKLRHRILAGILCFSIVFAGQPSGLKASTFSEEGDVEETVSYEGEEYNQNTEESTEMNAENYVEETDEAQEDIVDACDDKEINEDSWENITADSEEAEMNLPLLEDSTLPEPQTAEVHRHSVSVDCSVNAGEQVMFTELTGKGGSMPEGNYYLNEDISILSALQFSGNTNLCLNGHELRYIGGTPDSVITVTPNTTIHICDCGGNGTITGGRLSGIFVRTGTLNLYGGTITGNSVPASGTFIPDTVLDGWMRTARGGGICIIQGTFNMYGGSVSNNKNTDAGGSAAGGGVCVGMTGSDFLMGGSFQMYGGTISKNEVGSRGGGICCHPNTNTIIYSGTISDNKANATGGGIYISMGELLIQDVEISGNTAYNGGGISVSGIRSTVELSDGTISNNTATSENGGGVYIDSGNFLMSGGVITNNRARGVGGGIYSHHEPTYNTYGVCELSGGIISNNTARQGSGVYLLKCSKLSGTPVIHNNTNQTGKTDNLYIPSANSAVTISSSMSEGASIGVTYESSLGTVVTNSPFAIPEAGLDIRQYAQYFFCDDGSYGTLYKDTPTEGIYFGDGLTITYDYATNGGTSVSLASAFVEKNTTLDLSSDASNAVTAAKEGWEFLGWNTVPDATEGLDTLTVGTENVTLYAIYKKTITADFYSGNDGQKKTESITLYNNEREGTITTPDLADFPGWQAAGWDTDTTGYTGAVPEASDITISEDTDYYGVYQQDVTISYDANGGTTPPASETKKRYANVHNSITYRNPVFTLAPAVSYTGYTFDGWHQGSTAGTVKRPGTEVELIGNTTFYADWRLDTDRSYVVEHYWQNVTGDGYTLIDTVPHTGTAGAEAEAEARTYIGFAENTEHPSRKASGIIAEDGSLVLKLYYDRDIYTVSFDLNGAEGTPPEAQTIRYGGTVTPVPAPTWEGYVFTGWYMNDETGSGSRWDFTAAVEENERNQTRIAHYNANSRSVTHREIVLYAGWRKEAVDTPNEPVQPIRPTEPDTGNNNDNNNNSNTTINNNVTINNSNAGTSPTSGKPVPMTGDAAHLELYATAAMIAGLSYLLLEMADEQGMTEEKKRELTARLIRWAKQGGAIRRILAFMAMFLILAYYHAIGKQFSAKSIHVLEK